MFIGMYLSAYEDWTLFIATKRYMNKDEIPAHWLIGFILQGFECTEKPRSVSKSLLLNQWEGIFIPVLEFAQDLADSNSKDKDPFHSIPFHWYIHSVDTLAEE